MSATTVFTIGTAATLMTGLAVVFYLKGPLERILVELCGSQQRAEFWGAFSAVSLGLTPAIFAIGCRPAPGPATPAVFELADQLRWGLIGLMSSVLVLGWVIGRSITRWEKQMKSKVPANS